MSEPCACAYEGGIKQVIKICLGNGHGPIGERVLVLEGQMESVLSNQSADHELLAQMSIADVRKEAAADAVKEALSEHYSQQREDAKVRDRRANLKLALATLVFVTIQFFMVYGPGIIKAIKAVVQIATE